MSQAEEVGASSAARSTEISRTEISRTEISRTEISRTGISNGVAPHAAVAPPRAGRPGRV